jgi:hypothetical protein
MIFLSTKIHPPSSSKSKTKNKKIMVAMLIF